MADEVSCISFQKDGKINIIKNYNYFQYTENVCVFEENKKQEPFLFKILSTLQRHCQMFL